MDTTMTAPVELHSPSATTPISSAARTCSPGLPRSGPDQSCHFRSATSNYTLDFRFPVDYSDQQPVTDFLIEWRDDFVDSATKSPPRSFPAELDIIGHAYRSGTRASSTQSLVFRHRK
jgi:hypothetical protein